MARRLLVLTAWLAGACAADRAGPDGPASGGAPDAPPDGDGFPACRELATTPMPLPLHLTGDVVAESADLVAPAHCAVIDAPYGVQSEGVDAVIKIGGLELGREYGVSLTAAADLAFYVVTGCSSPTGPVDGECALFVDATLGGDDELGRFTATAATAWLVVDSYSTIPPHDGAFAVDVYAIDCADDSACGPDAPACLDGRCVGCADDFDCTAPDAASCDTDAHVCTTGDAACPGDDAGEPADDGPSGGRALVPDGTGTATMTGAICDEPAGEVDFYRFTVTQPGEAWELHLAWTGAADLDLYAYDAAGRELGLSFYEQPETIRLSYLAPGPYYVMVQNYATGNPTADAYTLTAHRVAGPGCTTAAACAAEYRNQLFRGACVAGACVSIDGDAGVAAGGACDSTSDCAAGLYCPSFFFVADADTRDRCAPPCDDDDDCTGGEVCTTYLYQNFCVAPCTVDDQCPAAPGTTPVSPPWYRLHCQTATGRCLP